MNDDDLDLLATALDATTSVLAGVRPDQLHQPTPCEELDVAALRDHIVGWMQMFEAWANGRRWEGDPDAYRATDAAAEFRALADSALDGWRRLGTDRTIEGMGGELPADFALSMTVAEYTVHGWDLARATGQDETIPADDVERLWHQATSVPPEVMERFRTPGAFGPGIEVYGPEVPVPQDAPLQDRLLGYVGRDPVSKSP